MTKQTEPQPVLVSADGEREWTPEDASQATNLRARGWTVKPAEDAEPAKPTAKAGTQTTDK